jgi:hypothetical protein
MWLHSNPEQYVFETLVSPKDVAHVQDPIFDQYLGNHVSRLDITPKTPLVIEAVIDALEASGHSSNLLYPVDWAYCIVELPDIHTTVKFEPNLVTVSSAYPQTASHFYSAYQAIAGTH